MDSREMDAIFKEATIYESFVLRLLMGEVNMATPWTSGPTWVGEDTATTVKRIESWIHNVTSLRQYCDCERKCDFHKARINLENFLAQITILLKR